MRKRTILSSLAAALLLHVVASCSSSSSAEPAKLQEALLELEGLVEVQGADTLFKLQNGKTYKIEGSLVRMIRGVYKGKTIKTAGKILEEPAGKNPGRYQVREVIVILE